MELFSRVRRALKFDDDALAAHRDGIRLDLSRMAAVVLVPFMLLHAAVGNWPMFSVNAVITSVMLANTLALRRGRRAVVPFELLGLVMVAGVCAAVLGLGVYGVLWAYPAVFMLYFVLQRGLAMVLGLVMLVASTLACSVAVGWPLATRVFLSVGFVLVMINTVLDVIGQLQAALVKQAITDPLTGAYNRRHLQQHLEQRVVAAGAVPGGDTLLAIDIDHFKRVNDRHGHAVGDEALCRLVAAIGARKRGSDLLFRTGGEEFVLLLPRITPEAALGVAEDLRQRVAQAELAPGETVTVSIGVSSLVPGQTAEAWLMAADRALYQAKGAGRNRVAVAAGH